MRKSGVALLILVALALPAAAQTAYLAARDRAIAAFKINPPRDDPSDTREGRALTALERQMKAIIPPWHAPGFSPEGKLTLSILHQDLGFGVLDGLAYGARGAEVIVTTPALVQRWIADHNKAGDASRDMPPTFAAATRSSQFWTSAYGDDNGWLFFGDVPVVISGGTGTAQLAVDTDSGHPDEGPKYLLVTVLRGRRVFVARQKLAINVSRQPICDTRLRADQGPQEQRAQHFQACYTPFLQQQPQWDAIRGQAQALVDLLH